MAMWPQKPYIYEINTAVWLTELSQKFGEPITLANVPDEVLDALADLHFDVIWLMGIWQRSAAARESALNYVHEYQPVLLDLTEGDVSGSAYAIGAYTVDTRFGGRKALAALRERLFERGIKLILDFVPNHVATDHQWVTRHPHYMVRGTRKDMSVAPDLFFSTRNKRNQELIVAHGRDPYFPGWIDTAQLNAFSADLRKAVSETLLDIAEQCDGVRCDMAMLMLNEVFDNTWGAYLPETAPNTEFWEEIIPAIKQEHPDFKFIAEVYWDMEYTLLQQGFDFTYDKRLYDRIQDGFVDQIREHLQAALPYQQRQIRFIENHDEPRAAGSLGIEKSRPAATLTATLPGGVLLHDGQLIGRQVKLPVQISRQPDEVPNFALEGFYRKLFHETRSTVYQYGEWRLFEIDESYPNNITNHHLLAYGWAYEDDCRIVVLNLTPRWSQGIVRVFGWDQVRGRPWRLFDVLGGVSIYHDGDQIAEKGLYVELEPYQSQLFRLEEVKDKKELEYLQRLNTTLVKK